MFDDAQKNEYLAIKAPARLKKRVEHTLTRPRFTARAWTAMAACIALVTVVSVFSFRQFAPKTVSLSYLGNEVTGQEVSVSGEVEKAVAFGAKTIVPTGIPLYAHAARNTKLSVSGGSIQIFDEDGALLSVGTDLTLDAPAEIRWDVSDLPTGSYTLSLATEIYEVRIDAENGTMLIYNKEKKQ